MNYILRQLKAKHTFDRISFIIKYHCLISLSDISKNIYNLHEYSTNQVLQSTCWKSHLSRIRILMESNRASYVSQRKRLKEK